jgi:signal transduction histidine kinase
VTGESAAKMPWLWPDAHSLAALAQPLSPETWHILRRDPAAVLLCYRQTISLPEAPAPTALLPGRFLEPRILESVLKWLSHDRGRWLDWRHPVILPIYRTALSIAHHARLIAGLTGACDQNAAWTGGLLAPLGWYAVAAFDPLAVAEVRADQSFPDDPIETQQRHWGLDHAGIARRLVRRWQLPDWLRIAVGHLDLPIETAEPLGADPALFATIQLAVGMAENAGYSLGLIPSLDFEAILDRLKINGAELRSIEDSFQEVDLAAAFETEWEDPRQSTWLPSALNKAIAFRRADTAPFLAPLEHDLDCMHTTLVQWKNTEEQRLRDAKLAALAEFAAGASHEINNPLAVISGQSQYLLHREIEEDFRPALESIVRQTQRIHAILTELMQFARPPQLKRRPIILGEAIHAAVESFRATANAAGVKLDCIGIPTTIWVDADPRHLQTAIGCLVRNAIEAATPKKLHSSNEERGIGWVRVGVEHSRQGVELIVEDSGTAPTTAQREHLFDPFYSGRSAGRGRGLGLPTAWRLAREHGGDVRHVPIMGGPTRFVLSLPLPDTAVPALERLSA